MDKEKEARYAKWRELLEEHAKSGLSQKRFCLERGIADMVDVLLRTLTYFETRMLFAP